MAKSKSSARWLQRRSDDVYIGQAKQKSWRSRAAIKLQQMDERYHLIRPNMRILDLGAAPGSWSQYFASRSVSGKIFAVDVLPMEPVPGVFFVQKDIADTELSKRMMCFFNHKKIDIVASDISPNITGISSVDMLGILYRSNRALEIAVMMLGRKGSFVIKVFQGQGFEEYLQRMKDSFTQVRICKPAASRSTSREVYILGRYLKDSG